MGNIKNYNFSRLDLKLSNDQYWDFYLASDDNSSIGNSGLTSGDCFVVWYDFNEISSYQNLEISSTTLNSIVSWSGGTNSGYTFNTIGLTGIDNGLVKFEKDILDVSNEALLSALTGTTLIIQSGTTKLILNQVTGFTGDYIYPINHMTGDTGDYKQFCGGFYQGYYKIDGSTYEVLPDLTNRSWAAEFWLKPEGNCSGYTGTTLNDAYPNNKGIFFYLGTRAENKFWNQFYGVNTGCTSACTISDSACTGTVSTFCTVIKESDVSILNDNGYLTSLIPPQNYFENISNPFLIYGRAVDTSPNILTGNTGTLFYSGSTSYLQDENCCNVNSSDGLGTKTVCTYDGNGIVIAKTKEIKNDYTNPFLIYGRGYGVLTGCSCSQCCGSGDGYGNQTVCSYSGNSIPYDNVNYNLDIIDNALGFRIKDDGSIGYRLMTVSGECDTNEYGLRTYTSGVTIEENYSVSGVVPSNVWSYIVIRFVSNFNDNCSGKKYKHRTGKLMFYVNSKLKYVVNDFPEFIAKRLDENYLKQIGVPFNISLGGGSQGLIDSHTFDGLDIADRGLPIEQNFAGSFIGGISQFKFNICDLNYSNIKFNYDNDIFRYNV